MQELLGNPKRVRVSRREFVKTGAGVVGGFVVAFYLPASTRKAFGETKAAPAAGAKPTYPPDAFIQIAPDNSITITINKLEMGQGVNTSMAQLIAEELECDWKSVRSVSAPVNPVYNHTFFGSMQMTGGSSALISSWEQHRKIGAMMREMLKAAAAEKWGVPVTEVTARESYLHHSTKGKLSYGEVAEQAAKMKAPAEVTLKSAKDFTVIGKSMKRVDADDKSNGKAIFGMDVRVPGMMYASIERAPMRGATVSSVANIEAARKIAGVVDVVKLKDRVAVLGKTTHAARQGRDELEVKWKLERKSFTDESLMKELKEAATQPGLLAKEFGQPRKRLESAKSKVTAEYEFPLLAHASMEPLNCTVDYDGKRAILWSGFQMPTVEKGVAAKILGLPPEKVDIRTTYAGGSFGRRACKNSDYLTEACQLAKVVKKPLKVVWTREDDMRGGYYRPMTLHRVTWGLTEEGQLAGWDHLIVGNSVIGGSVFEPMLVKNGIEGTLTEGVADTRYDFPHFRCEQTRVKSPVTTLWWRSVGHTHTAFVMESVLDELAEATKKDPLALRREYLSKSPRHLAVLEELEKLSGWGSKKPAKGRAWGLAIHESFNSVVGNVVEASVEGGVPKVHRVWSVAHCGQVVNPEGAKTQIESAIAFGLSAALYQKIRIENGSVVSANFDDFKVVRISEMPEVMVSFVPSTDQPTGLGEPGLPPLAPALANALYQLTGKRIRKFPLGTLT